jgi:hypothetical protein
MAEVLVEFDTTIRTSDGARWAPRACGRPCVDGMWEGWIEFTPSDDALDPVRTSSETTQPNRADLMYWAQGLTQVYLQDALVRALEPPPRARLPRPAALPHFEGPAPPARAESARHPGRSEGSALRRPHPLLNPFNVYLQGEDVLVRELSALDEARVRDIAVAFGLLTAPAADALTRDELSASIVAGVRHQATPGAENERSDISS